MNNELIALIKALNYAMGSTVKGMVYIRVFDDLSGRFCYWIWREENPTLFTFNNCNNINEIRDEACKWFFGE